MKKMLTIAVVTGLMGIVAAPAMADNHRGHGYGYSKEYRDQAKAYQKYQKDRAKIYQKYNRDDRYGRYNRDDRRYRPMYQNSPHRSWRRGQVLDRSYRGQGYWVDYRQHPRLYAPAKNQRWVRVDNDYLLVNSLSNVIVSILTGR